MLTLMLILALTGVTLAVFLYAGSMFLQGYIYTEPSQDLYWQAPAAGAALMVFLTLWCVLVVNAEGATRSDIPYDTLINFKSEVKLLEKPAKEITAVKKRGEKILYTSERQGQTRWRYYDKRISPYRPWSNDGVVAIELVKDGESFVFKRANVSEGSYPEFVSDKGWVMKDYGDGPDIPSVFRWGRFLLNIFLNFGHFLVWWLGLWLLMRFQLGHALGLAAVLWLIFTLALLPMLLTYAADVAQSKAAPAGQPKAALHMASRAA